MPKLKTKKGVAKRFKLTKNKKIKYRPGGKSHLATSKQTERIRKLRKGVTVDEINSKKYLLRMLPYG
jgi:large subunit ribosomal protein L35